MQGVCAARIAQCLRKLDRMQTQCQWQSMLRLFLVAAAVATAVAIAEAIRETVSMTSANGIVSASQLK